MEHMDEDNVRKMVRKGYAKIAKQKSSCCCSEPSCASGDIEEISRKLGYSDEEMGSVPEGANLSLGCGNPIALASLKEGEVVLDLGSGGGFDCFLAARRVGEKGKVIGVDMTPEMIDKARENAGKGKYKNVEFRLGEIENLPAADDSVDVVISNCVINLSPNKQQVFREAFRVLKPGGRVMISDIVLLKELPATIKNNVRAYVGCVSGAILKDRYMEQIQKAGFEEVEIIEESFPIKYLADSSATKTLVQESKIRVEEAKKLADSIVSIRVSGTKPK
jgi:SAM-dependent methyltransferase